MENIKHRCITGIYKIVNSLNNKFYIGSSKSIYYRVAKHKSRLKKKKHANSYLQNSVNKYGLDAFKVLVIEECLEEDLLKREQHYIDTLNPEYNLVKDAIRQLKTPEFCKKMSRVMKKSYKEGRSKPTRSRAVNVYDRNGEFIKTYEEVKIMYLDLDLKCSPVYRVLTKKQVHTKGFQLFYADEPQIPIVLRDLVQSGTQLQQKRVVY